MSAYYNEIDPFAAQWLRNLIHAGHIAPGVVDERSIEDILPSEIKDFDQCHFFAGVGVWSLAIRRAGWSDDRPVWTGSCPCQPFSAAGAGSGFDDERHLWPALHHLIKECRPAIVFGEQVASKAVEPWIDLVHADVEALGYAFGCVPFPAAGVGAPHIRDRAYWVADSGSIADRGQVNPADHIGTEGDRPADRAGRRGRSSGGLADADSDGRQSGRAIRLHGTEHDAQYGRSSSDEQSGPTNGHWRDADWLFCRDRKWRPVEPGSSPLVNGASGRVGRLRAYGNAICAQAAEEFVRACA